ncbi:HAD-IA family hydrolase [Corynebacterium guaraldiae]|uniref:HAD-IA family hydrolase n=1 Tax=Corynebacterium guaraldiae TaxID=3051103 RepID=UPI0012B6B929|nr:HAD-IA family hydrolase [Corynebacterium guaraldiae]MTD96553.1 HAD-IA family hydrolase [Corynebacterium guaraldiae]
MATLLFDLYGVLMRSATPAGNAELEDYLRPDNVEHFWSLYEEFRPAYDAGHLSDAQYWSRIRALAGLAPFDVSHAIELDTEHLLVADEEMVRAVLGFIGQGHSVGTLANVPAALGTRIRQTQPWLEECAAVTLSCDIGVAKPDPEAYLVAVDALGAQAKDTHFFDDRPDFVAGAQNLGLKAHLFTGITSIPF